MSITNGNNKTHTKWTLK